MAITIINEFGSATRTANVEAADAETHIAARDRLASEAEILRAYDADDSLADRDPLAWKYADPTEDGRFLFTEEDVAAIEHEDPSLIERIVVKWVE